MYAEKMRHTRIELLPAQLDSADEIYIPWSNTFLMWHDYWFGNDPRVKVMLDNMALLRRLLGSEKCMGDHAGNSWSRKLAEKENCRDRFQLKTVRSIVLAMQL